MENTFETIRQILSSPLWGVAWKVFLVSMAVLWLALVFWTLKDARRRIDDTLIVLVAVATSLVFPFIGTLVYMMLRPSEYLVDARGRELEMLAVEQELRALRICPNCHEPVREEYVACPKCRRPLREPCGNCGRPLEYWWKLCPYCGRDAAVRPVSPGVAAGANESGSARTPTSSPDAAVGESTQLLEF